MMISRVIEPAVRTKAFSLIELLVVLAIIGILISMLIVGMDVARKKAKVTRAHTEVKQLAQAWKSYWMIYGSWPKAISDGGSKWIPMDAAQMKMLMTDNTLKLFDANENVTQDGFKDPWDTLYEVQFTKDGADKNAQDMYQAVVVLPNKKRYYYDQL